MSTPPVSSIQPFLPARDFELSKQFYLALGFDLRFANKDICGFNHGSGAFLLQNYYVRDWAENFMIAWAVDDLNAWYAHVQTLDLPDRFGVPPVKPPTMQPWGLVISYLVDPCGVLWHVSQKQG